MNIESPQAKPSHPAIFGKIDIVATAPGRIIASDRTKVIQPLKPAWYARRWSKT